jgi:hypothetical protein
VLKAFNEIIRNDSDWLREVMQIHNNPSSYAAVVERMETKPKSSAKVESKDKEIKQQKEESIPPKKESIPQEKIEIQESKDIAENKLIDNAGEKTKEKPKDERHPPPILSASKNDKTEAAPKLNPFEIYGPSILRTKKTRDKKSEN